MILTPDLIYGFVGSCLAKRFDGSLPTPQFHKEMWEYCCSPQKFVAIAAPRGHAKSTSITLSYSLASALFRSKEFILIVSDTETQSNLFLGAIKQELTENQEIIDLFGIKRDPNTGIVRLSKDTESDMICEFEDGHSFRIISKGAEQKLRGLLWNGKRPDLIVIDDVENDELVMNKDRREKFRRWFQGALLPCRSQNGEIRMVGTILHMDSMLERLMPEFQLQGKQKDLFIKRDELKEWTDHRTPWKSIKYKAHNEDFSKILWPEKWTKETLKEERQKYLDQGLSDVYSQEYLNIPLDDSVAFFKKTDLKPEVLQDKDKRLNYYVACDLAISEKEKADYTVMVVGGVDQDGYLYVKHVIRDRMDSIQIIDTILMLQKLYEPICIGIEDTAITKSLGPFLREAMLSRGIFPSIVPLKPHRTDKVMRARSIQARMRAGAVKFDKTSDWYQTLEDEMLRFPRARHDDQVDAMAYLGLLIDFYIEAQTDEEVKEDEYYEELESSGYNEIGRSEHTGY